MLYALTVGSYLLGVVVGLFMAYGYYRPTIKEAKRDGQKWESACKYQEYRARLSRKAVGDRVKRALDCETPKANATVRRMCRILRGED